MELHEWLEKFLAAIETVGADIIKNWGAFLTIFVLYTIAVVVIVRLYYKHTQENIELDKKLLDARKSEYDNMKVEYEKYKKEIDSPEYQAYLLAHNMSKTDMSDADMFSRKKKK